MNLFTESGCSFFFIELYIAEQYKLILLPFYKLQRQFAKVTAVGFEVSGLDLQHTSALAYLRSCVILWKAARAQPPAAAGSETRPLQRTLLPLDNGYPVHVVIGYSLE